VAKHVIILGAGASAEVGAPVMENFLDVAEGLFASKAVSNEKVGHFQRVFSAISRLQSVHSKAEFDLVNIESIFTAFELSKTLGRFPGLPEEEIDGLIQDLKWLIVVTLENTVRFPVEDGRFILSHPPYFELVKAIEAGGSDKPTAAILSFNYDIALDRAVAASRFGIDYGIEKERHGERWLPVLKLHGSLNWTTSVDEAGRIVPWYLKHYLKCHRLDPFGPAHSVLIPIGSQLREYRTENNEALKVDGIPVIVPPSWNKADSHRAVSKVWARAAEELSEAESIYVVGYSLPITDSFFRQLFALGTVGPTVLKRFWVFNPDPSRQEVFRSMLGPGARSRFRFFQVKFAEATGLIADAVKEK
jgi:hypothetical protein